MDVMGLDTERRKVKGIGIWEILNLATWNVRYLVHKGIELCRSLKERQINIFVQLM